MILVIPETLDDVKGIPSTNFADLAVLERKHLQEWVRSHPQILGEELLIVGMEFNSFEGSRDRLDLLALDRKGNLVIVELKRDDAAGHADLQAIRYAAMMSSMTLATLTGHYVSYLRSYCSRQIAVDEAGDELAAFISAKELSDRPRIILCAQGFSQEIKQTALWLNEANVQIKCVTVTPYKVGDKIIVVADVIIPLIEEREYQIAIKAKQEEREKPFTSARLNVKLLLDAGLLQIGDTIYLKAELPDAVQFREHDPTFEAVITGQTGRSNAVRWKKDNQEYSISRLAWTIFNQLRPEKKEIAFVSGKRHWVNSTGLSLLDLEQKALTSVIGDQLSV